MTSTSIFLRSLAFNVLFYLTMAIWFVAALPTFAMPRATLVRMAQAWGRWNIWLMRVICGTHVNILGLERIPKGPLIIASKHQSMWETFALFSLIDQPIFILKRELKWIPFFGWYLTKAGMIGIDRKAGMRTLKMLARMAREQMQRGRQLVIFPEGTRRPVGAPPTYKSGVAMIYAEVEVPCLPVALNSGLCWPRRTFLRYPGTITVEFLDPLPPGLRRNEFMSRLTASIEGATDRLVEAGRREQAQLFGRLPEAPAAED
jgi:1-acyl-sn-glycerol-3-phosphate acyltransferase